MCTANFLISGRPWLCVKNTCKFTHVCSKTYVYCHSFNNRTSAYILPVTPINCLSHNDFDLDYRIDSRICLTFLNMRIINCLSQNEWMVSTIELVDFPEQHFLINLIKKISLRKWRQLFICSPLMLYWKVIKLEHFSQSSIVKIWPLYKMWECQHLPKFWMIEM